MNSREFLSMLNLEQRGLLRRAWPFVGGYVVVATAPQLVLDLWYDDQVALYFWARIWALGAEYLVTLALLRRSDLLPAGERSGVGTYFALVLATSIPISLAMIVLILPGLYLLMRWLPVFARALATQDWISGSMSWSWRVTEPVQLPLGIALIGPVLCHATSFALWYFYDYSHLSYEVTVLLMNVGSTIGSGWIALLGVAAFALLGREPSHHGSIGLSETA